MRKSLHQRQALGIPAVSELIRESIKLKPIHYLATLHTIYQLGPIGPIGPIADCPIGPIGKVVWLAAWPIHSDSTIGQHNLTGTWYVYQVPGM